MSDSAGGAKFTRRKLGAALAPAVLSSAARGQNPASPAGADEELRLARERIRNNSGAVAKVKLPMATEPAFQFKA